MAQPKSGDAKKWYEKANKKNWEGDYEAALSFCDRALSLDPSYYKAWNCRGNALRMLGRNQEAIASFDKALEIKPQFENAWNNRGLALDSLEHHHEEALKSFNKALEIKRDYQQAWNNRGNALRSLRSYSEAIASYDEALRLTSNQYWQAWNNRGWAFFFSSRYQEALENWDEGLRKLNQPTQSYREGCGELYYSKGRAYYKYSKQQSNPRSDWMEAKNSYQLALQYLTFRCFPYRHLKVLQELLKVYSACQLEQFEEWMATWQRDYETNNKHADCTEQEDMRKRWRERMPDRLHQLGEILEIEKILAQLSDASQLLLIPHRDLHLLPLHCLFPEDITITYLPSFQVGFDLQQLRQSPVGTNHEIPLLSVEQPKGKNSLVFTLVESAVIAQLYSEPIANRLVGLAATKEAVTSALEAGEGVFHFTGHGYHDIDTPAKSFLELANGEQLSLKDIFDSTLPSYYLVCLSACETGVTGNQGLIDEFVGLASGFFSKRAIYVVSSLWRVDERSTALLMMRFHQLLKEKGMAPAQALKQAQRWLCNLTKAQLREWYLELSEKLTSRSDRKIKSFLNREAENLQEDSRINPNECPYAEPYFWAGFTIAGKVL